MFSELPKLFDRNFALGYFLPSTLYLLATLYLLDKFNLISNVTNQLQMDLLTGTSAIGLTSWLISILLLGTNRSIYRLLEGYGKINPLKLFLGIEKWKYKRALRELENLDDKYRNFQEKDEPIPVEVRIKRNRTMQLLAEKFPDGIEWLLPTPFGNVIRAFEVYPRVVYGIEAIQGWNRLLAVIPKDYQDLIDNAKAQVDFWVNLGVLSVLSLFEFLTLSVFLGKSMAPEFIIPASILVFISASRAEGTAILWGELVKSSFDVFLPKLKKELDLSMSQENERNLWTQFSQAIIYRLPSGFSKIRNSKEKDGTRKKNSA